MPTKLQLLSDLAEETAKRVTSSFENWTGFLTIVGRLYKYPYHEQLMIYAQRPDATACAEYDRWNNTMNRYVRRGSKGIALLDPTGDTPIIKYVFDISDTGGRENSSRPFLCAQHGRKLVGESPIRRLIVPTVSLRQGCPS